MLSNALGWVSPLFVLLASASLATSSQGPSPLTRPGVPADEGQISELASSDTSTLIGGYKVKLTSAGKDAMGFCQEAELDIDVMIRLCGDDDGCSLHLTSDALVRAVSDVVRLVFSPLTYEYTLNQGGYEGSSFSSTIGDSIGLSVFRLESPSGKPHCEFLEDTPSNNTFGFSVCHSAVPTPDEQGPSMSCTLRIED
jgi:hypothetical protein